MLLAIKNDLVFSFYLEGYSNKPRILYLMEPGKRFANLEHVYFQPFQAFYKHKMLFALLLLGKGEGPQGLLPAQSGAAPAALGFSSTLG